MLRVAAAESRDGPGDSEREGIEAEFCDSAEMSEAPHNSQLRSDGWLRKVQRGHWNCDWTLATVDALFGSGRMQPSKDS